jgi:hypothetical protein
MESFNGNFLRFHDLSFPKEHLRAAAPNIEVWNVAKNERFANPDSMFADCDVARRDFSSLDCQI